MMEGRPPPPSLAAICSGAAKATAGALDLECVATPRTANGVAAARRFPIGSLVRPPPAASSSA